MTTALEIVNAVNRSLGDRPPERRVFALLDRQGRLRFRQPCAARDCDEVVCVDPCVYDRLYATRQLDEVATTVFLCGDCLARVLRFEQRFSF